VSRIFIICHPLIMGGTEKTIVELTNELNNDYDITIATITTGKQKKEDFYETKKSIERLEIRGEGKIFSYILMIVKLRGYIKSRDPDVVLSFLTIPSIFALLACNIQSQRVIAAERTDPKHTPNVPIHWRMLRCITYGIWLKRLVVQSRTLGASFPYVRNKYVRIIPNACKSQALDMTEKVEASHVANKSLSLLYIGRFEYQKGVDLLLAALKLLRDDHPEIEWNLVIVGKGEKKDEYSKLISKYNLEGHVSIRSAARSQNEVVDYMRRSDFVVLPSRWEGLPNVLIEALTNGRPVIASKQAAAGFIIDEVNGLLISRNTALEIKYCLTKAYRMKIKKITMQKEILLTANHFRPDVVYKRWKCLISEIVNK